MELDPVISLKDHEIYCDLIHDRDQCWNHNDHLVWQMFFDQILVLLDFVNVFVNQNDRVLRDDHMDQWQVCYHKDQGILACNKIFKISKRFSHFSNYLHNFPNPNINNKCASVLKKIHAHAFLKKCLIDKDCSKIKLTNQKICFY